ncbi:MAG: S-layer homology domain-containing protein [Clostridia bacterium]|nr:S-layer homology domain-containing protein [Clostridia bacterium]
MKKNYLIYYILCVVFLVCLFVPYGVYASNNACTVTVDGRIIDYPDDLEPYKENGEIMIPLGYTISALGGIEAEPFGDDMVYRIFAINNIALGAVDGLGFYIVMDYEDMLELYNLESVNYFDKALQDKFVVWDDIFDEKGGEMFLSVNKFCDIFEIEYQIRGNNVNFDSDSMITYGEIAAESKMLRIDFELPGKTYDGKPYSWDESLIKAYYNGKQVTDYMPFEYEYVGTNSNYDDDIYSSSKPPKDAGAYTLIVRTDPDDDYVGAGTISFIISPKKISINAVNESIMSGSALPDFKYEVTGIVDGETIKDAISSEPKVFTNAVNGNAAGTYDIWVSDGKAGKNYIIDKRNKGILTIENSLEDEQEERVERESDNNMAVIKINCVDEDGDVIYSGSRRYSIGEYITIYAPELDDYILADKERINMEVRGNESVTFNYEYDYDYSYDYDEDYEYNDYSYTAHNAYINGYPDGTFRPNAVIKRCEGASMLYSIMNLSGYDKGYGSFRDVEASAWYSNKINTLNSMNIIRGYPDMCFKPDKAITRAEFIVMVLRAEEINISTNKCDFYDVSQNYWAAQYIQTASEQGIVSGYPDGSFAPEMGITRAEAVLILNNVTGRNKCSVEGYGTYFSDVDSDKWYYSHIISAACSHKH